MITPTSTNSYRVKFRIPMRGMYFEQLKRNLLSLVGPVAKTSKIQAPTRVQTWWNRWDRAPYP